MVEDAPDTSADGVDGQEPAAFGCPNCASGSLSIYMGGDRRCRICGWEGPKDDLQPLFTGEQKEQEKQKVLDEVRDRLTEFIEDNEGEGYRPPHHCSRCGNPVGDCICTDADEDGMEPAARWCPNCEEPREYYRFLTECAECDTELEPLFTGRQVAADLHELKDGLREVEEQYEIDVPAVVYHDIETLRQKFGRAAELDSGEVDE